MPYLRVANVQRGYLDLSEVKQIDAPRFDIEDLRLQLGDILFNQGGDRDKLGRGWIWEGQLPECIYQNHVFRARLYSDELSPKLVSWWGNTFGRAYFLREGKQTTEPCFHQHDQALGTTGASPVGGGAAANSR